ncbi:myrosinase 1-like [Rhodnius prolixus]|uniref:myrosinase 1-like n=1 Tax=Rhodnius prolixus TaxID=13249 RepID=UPI003D18F910
MNVSKTFKKNVFLSLYLINLLGKGIHIWDSFTHLEPYKIIDRSNGDVASDSYYKYKEDIQNVHDLKFDMYRFSIMWARILPDGYRHRINQKGIDFYNRFIDEVLSKGKQPMVTLYHWDLPQPIEDNGGWLNPAIVQIFADYADLIFNHFGDKVKWWITVNEPMNVAAGYGTSVLAPGLDIHGVGEYLAGHNIIKAHANVFRLYERKYRIKQQGNVSINLSGLFGMPLRNNSHEDEEAAERHNQFTYGWFGHPIYSKEGDYPRVMREYIDRNSALEGRKQSRLPYFTREEINYIRGRYIPSAALNCSPTLVFF